MYCTHSRSHASYIKTMYCFVHCVFTTCYIYYFIINSTYSMLLVKHGLNYIFHLVLMGQLVTLVTIVCLYDIYNPSILFLVSKFSIWLLIFGCSFCLFHLFDIKNSLHSSISVAMAAWPQKHTNL